MDCRLQISDLESRLNTLASIKTELADCQTQSERLRASLDATESKLASTEKRAIEAEGLIRIKDSIIEKQRNFSKEVELQVKGLTEENESLRSKCGNLEMKLNEALDRAEECDRLRDVVAAKTELLDKLAENSDGLNEAGLAAANEYFKAQETKMLEQIAEMKQSKFELEARFNSLTCENDVLKGKLDKQETDLTALKEKCTALETRSKESGHSDRRSRSDAANARLIGPSLPPWKLEEKKTDPSDLEKLANADPATLRSRVLELEGQVHELNQLLTYREDVILRIHEEISKKASRLEAAEVERSSLSAQVSILKRELACLRDDAPRRRGGYPPEVEIELVRLRGKRDREYQRRKRAETEMDELDQENTELKAKIKALEETISSIPPPKPPAPVCDPADKSRIAELQAAASQLRMDNEAKRSELFDLRSRFDERSAQLDKLTSEMKTKERALSELSVELSTKVGQLEYANKELEAVRCRVVRGGSETERWQTDLNSVRTTNRFLSSQANELRQKLASTEQQLAQLQNKFISMEKSSSIDNESIVTDQTGTNNISNGEHMCNGLSPLSDERKNNETVEALLENQTRQCRALERRLSEASAKESELIDMMDFHKNKLDEKNAEITELSVKFSDLKHVHDRLEKQVTKLSEDLHLKSQECRLLENSLQETSSKLTSRDEQIVQLNESVHKLTRRCSELEDELKLLSSLQKAHDAECMNEKNEQINSLNSKLIEIETQFKEATDSIKELRSVESELDSMKAKCLVLEQDLENARKIIDNQLKEKSLHDAVLETEISNQNEKLLLEIKENQKSIIDSHQRCSSLATKVGDLESEVENLRAKLAATTADNRRTDIEKIAQATSLSPPAKRARRTRRSNAATIQPTSECALCAELKSQIESLELDLSEANNCRSTSTSDLVEVRRQLAKAEEEICELNRRISSLLDSITEANEKLMIHHREISHLLQEFDSQILICSGDTTALENLRKLTALS